MGCQPIKRIELRFKKKIIQLSGVKNYFLPKSKSVEKKIRKILNRY